MPISSKAYDYIRDTISSAVKSPLVENILTGASEVAKPIGRVAGSAAIGGAAGGGKRVLMNYMEGAPLSEKVLSKGLEFVGRKGDATKLKVRRLLKGVKKDSIAGAGIGGGIGILGELGADSKGIKSVGTLGALASGVTPKITNVPKGKHPIRNVAAVGIGAVGVGGVAEAIKGNVWHDKLKKQYPELNDIDPKMYSELYTSIIQANPGLVDNPFVLKETIKGQADYGTLDLNTYDKLVNQRSGDNILSKALNYGGLIL